MIRVFKFGGASVRSAEAIRQVAKIVRDHGDGNLLVVVSAMGKTTNALEGILTLALAGKDYEKELTGLHQYHEDVIQLLFDPGHPVWQKVEAEFDMLRSNARKVLPADQLYDLVVSSGELVSSRILTEFLVQEKFNASWVDARNFITTDNTYREGKIDWEATGKKITSLLPDLDEKIIVTQGFIGATADGKTVTLGREGSDFSAAIFASCLDASSVTIWKDVPGVMNADPKRLKDAIVFKELPFRETAEMTYYGATVIHPKTIKPLANKGIPLYVKNFDDPTLPGTVIHETVVDNLPPLFVFKDNQCLVSCRATDYTFIEEQQLSYIFQALSDLNIKINVMQNSAISFSFCIDFREDKVLSLVERLAHQFEVYYNTGLTLITVKNYDDETFERYRKMPGVLLEQSSRSTFQILLKGNQP